MPSMHIPTWRNCSDCCERSGSLCSILFKKPRTSARCKRLIPNYGARVKLMRKPLEQDSQDCIEHGSMHRQQDFAPGQQARTGIQRVSWFQCAQYISVWAKSSGPAAQRGGP
ncbi:hypothetical protein MN608_02387 [Microdochium nivale]|nr:hypothetical protein MN608_02387 [Microdochium nivale]